MQKTIEKTQQRTGLDFSTRQKEPLLKFHTIPIGIKRFYTDVDGFIIPKVAAVQAVQCEFPFFIWGDFDRQGGYYTGFKAVPLVPGSFYLMTFVEGYGMTSQQITGFTGFNNIRGQIKTGDIVHVYTDNLTAPINFVWIILSSNNGSIGSIVGNSETHQKDGQLGRLYVDHFQYFSDNTDPQWNIPIHFTRSSNIATWKDDQVQPYIFKNPYTEQDGFIRVACHFNLDQYQSIGTYFLYDTESIRMNFNIGFPQTA